MRVLRGITRAVLIAAFAAVFGTPSSLGAGVTGSDTVRLQTFANHSRLSLRIDEGVGAKFSSSKEGFELFLSGATLLDLGAPLGEESGWRSQFASMKDPRLSKIQFEETTEGVRITGAWSFPKGEEALENPVMEFFDFRDKGDSRYVVDFWAKKSPTLAQAQVIHRKVKQDTELKEAEQTSRKRAERRIASLKAKEEAEDTLRFCRQPISESNDVFLPAYGEHEKVNFAKWIPATTPDSDFTYSKYPHIKNKEPSQYVRLALHLYDEGKPALAVRTVDFLERDYPDSAQSVEMRFLKANSLIKLGLQEEAERMLGKIITDSSQAPVAIHAAAYLAVKRFERGQSLAALETFLWLLQRTPNHRLAWVFHLGAAEALFALKQTDRAVKEYQWVAENAPDRRSKAEGALREGDLFLSRLQHDQALAAYFQALSRFQDEARAFPWIHLNRAETLYGLGQWDRSERAFKDFLESYPAHSSGWMATFRLGEIEGRSEDATVREKGRAWYFETINRYPFSPAATLARLRLLPCGDHGGLNEAAALKFLGDEANAFTGDGSFQTTNYGGLRALARVRTLAAFGHEDQAVDAGLDELANGAPIGESKVILGHYLRVLFRRAVANLLENGKRFEALALYDRQGKRIPSPGPGDPGDAASDYLLKLSQAASDLGFSQVALGLADSYRAAESRAAGRKVAAEDGAGSEDLEVRMQTSEKSFAEAKALWISIASVKKPNPEAYAPIRKLLAAVVPESPFSQQSEIILGLMDEREGKLAPALAHGTRAQLLESGDLRLIAWGARLEAQAGDPRVALEMYRNLENHQAITGKARVAPEIPEILAVPQTLPLIETILAEAEQQEKLGHWGDAALTYERAIGSGKGGTHAVYGCARALLNAGGVEGRGKALKLLEKLASGESSDDFWARLARQKLADERKREPSAEK